jgi:hypothetical protein
VTVPKADGTRIYQLTDVIISRYGLRRFQGGSEEIALSFRNVTE